MNTTERTTVFGVNKKIVKTVHYIMLFGMLHSTFVAPAQVFLFDYINAPKPVVTKWGTFYEEESKRNDESELIQSQHTIPVVPEKVITEVKIPERENQVYYSDIEQGFIGLSEEAPLDDAKDNLFRLHVSSIPQNTRAYLKYDLYGVEGVGSVSMSINDLPSTGGHIIKKSNKWSSQQEELDVNWLKQGDNTILFTAPSVKGYGYKIKDLRIEFAENKDYTSSLILNIDENNLYKKENKIYIKGFVNSAKTGLKVDVNGISLSVLESGFEGIIELTDDILDKKHLVVRASDNKGLLGQEIIPLTTLHEADLFVPFEVSMNNRSVKTFDAFSGSELYTDGAGIIIPDSALVEKKSISVSQLRKKDIAPLNSGMINVTKNGTAYRFLPDGTKFQKEAKILLEYDPKLIPSGYSERDVKTFYFNTKSKSWVSVERDSVDLSNRMIISNTNHFTDYINGIIQTPETPESSAFVPTMMSDIKAADPSAGITLIAPPEVSQKGSAGISYPIKVPAGRNGMQPSLAIQYNSDGGNGFLGQGWDISIPAITIDTRWGVPVLDNNYETEIYTLNGEQLMYPKIKNLENDYEDWMPNRHYIDGFDNGNPIYNTTPRARIENAVFTPRKQGSFAKIERLGTNPENYYWKVTDTNGTISWYGGKTALNDQFCLKNTDNKVVHWSLFMVEDVFGNNIKYEYIKEDIVINTNDINLNNLNGGVFYRIGAIKYTGYNNADGAYSVVFNADNAIALRNDITIDSRLGIKQVTPRVLSNIEVKLDTELIRKYDLFYGTGKFGKSRLEAVAETDGSNKEFYRHNFEYYDDLKEGENDVYFSAGVDIDTCDDEDDGGSNNGDLECFCAVFPHRYINFSETSIVFTGYAQVETENGIITKWGTYKYDTYEDFISFITDFYGADITSYGTYPIGVSEFKICNSLWRENTSVQLQNTSEEVLFEMEFVNCEEDEDIQPTTCYCSSFHSSRLDFTYKSYSILFTSDINGIAQTSTYNLQEFIGMMTGDYTASVEPIGNDPILGYDFMVCNPSWNPQYSNTIPVIDDATQQIITYIEFNECMGNKNQFSSLKSQYFGLSNNSSYTFEGIFGNPDCPSMVNAEFLVEGIVPSFNSYFSPLGSSSTKSESVGGYLGIIGFGCNFLSKNSTLGAGYNVSGSKSKSEVSMIDINGDGLNDIVIQENGSFKYRLHTVERTYDESGNEVISHSFGERRPITGIEHFYNSVGSSEQINFSFNSYASVGWEKSKSKSTTTVYFTDANGDGLIDIVKNGVVYFNRLNANGDPHFYQDSKETENLVIVAEPMTVVEPVEESEFVLPAYDVVKVWEAPANGAIEIDNYIQLTDLSKEAIVTIEIRPFSETEEPEEPDCTTCENCVLCPQCEDCIDDDCISCTDCSECPDCDDCDENVDCTTCQNCVLCPQCEDCIDDDCISCTDCSQCPDCDDCDENVDCSTCTNCALCIDCPDCEENNTTCYTVTFPFPFIEYYGYQGRRGHYFIGYEPTTFYGLCHTEVIEDIKISNQIFNPYNLFTRCGNSQGSDFSNCLTPSDYLNYTQANPYYGNSNPQFYQQSTSLSNDIFQSFPEMYYAPSFVEGFSLDTPARDFHIMIDSIIHYYGGSFSDIRYLASSNLLEGSYIHKVTLEPISINPILEVEVDIDLVFSYEDYIPFYVEIDNNALYQNSFVYDIIYQPGIFQQHLSNYFPNADISFDYVNKMITITVSDTTQNLGSITITSTDNQTSNTYNFVEIPCRSQNKALTNKQSFENDWISYKPSEKEINYHKMKSIAEGKELSLPFTDLSLIQEVFLDKNMNGLKSGKYYWIKSNKNDELWINEQGETLSDKNSINVLDELYYSKLNRVYLELKQKNQKEESDQRVKAQREAQVWLETNNIFEEFEKNNQNIIKSFEKLDYKGYEVKSYRDIKKKKVNAKLNKNNNSNQVESCQDVDDLCLLFGEKLNSIKPVVDKFITTFSEDCISGGGTQQLTVKKGDRIYFRVHSVENGNPPVIWNPKVSYTESQYSNVIDQNGYNVYSSSYSDGFILSQPTSFVFPEQEGKIFIDWQPFQVDQPSSDRVRFKIIERKINSNTGEAIGQDVTKYCWGCVAETSTTVAPPNNFTIDVSAPLGQFIQLLFVAESTSNVKWKDYTWNPVVTTRFTQNVVVDGNDEGQLISNETYYPTVDYTVYKQYSCGPVYSTYDISQLSGNISSIRPVYNGIFSEGDYGKVHFVVKNDDKLVGSRTLIINNGHLGSVSGQSIHHSDPIPLQNLTGTNIEIGFYVEDAKFYLNGQTLASKLASTNNTIVRIVNHAIPKENINIYHRNNKFGPMYRQWGQFFYNPGKVTGSTSTDYGNLIKEDVLFRDYTEQEINSLMGTADAILSNSTIQGGSTIDDILPGLGSLQDNLNDELIGLESDLADLMQEGDAFLPARAYRSLEFEDRWIGLHNENYATANGYRAATLYQSLSSEYDVEPYNFQDVLNTGAYGINKIFRSKGQNISGGASFIVGVSASKSINGEGKAVTEYTDLNGDRYPDVVTTNEIQFTTRTGGLKSPSNRTGKESIVTLNSNSNWGVGVSGGLGGNNDQQGSSKSYMPKGQVSVITNSTKPNTSIGLSINFSKGKNFTDSFWSDVNGDGLPDLVTKSGGDVFVYLNRGGKLEDTGYKWSQLSSVFNSEGINIGGGVGFSIWNSSIQTGVSLTSSWNNTKNTFIDMNGDGLLDYIHTGNDLDVNINRGNRYSNSVKWSGFDLEKESISATASKNGAATFSLGFGIPFTNICIKFLALTGNGALSTSTNKTEKMIADFDGDGYPDLIEKLSESGTKIRVYHSRIRRTDKLKSVTNPLGGKFTVDYKVHKVDYDNPNPKWVMSSVEIEDGYDLANDGHDVYRKEFVYENPRYDRRERDFYGFETVKTIDYTLDEEGEQDEIYRTSVTKYHNRSYFLNGLVKETTIYKGDMDNNELYSKSENTYEIRRLGNDNNSVVTTTQGILPENFDVGGSEGRRSAVVLLSKTKSYVYELGNSPLVSESTMTYDEKGRVGRFDYLGAPNNQQDNYSTEIGYHNISTLTDKNIITIPFRIVVSVNGQVKRLRETDNIDLATGTIGTLRHFYTTNAYAQVDLKYDEFGNVIVIAYPENLNGQRMSYTYQYDSTYNKHVIDVTDAFGYTSQTQYNFSFDVPTEVTDIAGNKTQYAYDSFGRMIQVRGPKEIQSNKPYTIQFKYYPKYSDIQNLGVVSQNDFIPVALTQHYDIQNQNNTIDTYTFIDGLARPVQVKKDITINTNTNPSANPTYSERMSVSGAVTYDEFGRAVKQYHPKVEAKDNSVNFRYNNTIPPLNSNYFTQSIYDPLDRVVETIDEVGSQAFMEYSVDGNLHKTRSIVQQSSSVDIVSESFKDVNGRVVKTNNIGPQGDIITTFIYNAIGELLSYTDDMNMTTSYKYDMLGRKTVMDHPDRGITEYIYDDASNLTRLQTANLIQQNTFIQYEYEYNRLYRIIFPQPQQGPINIADVYYEYGSPNSGNQTGRLVFQQDASGTQSFQYGNMGELIGNARTIVAPSPTLPTRTFETSFVYDSWNRLQSMTYPDGEGVKYSYDLGGNLKQVEGDMQYVQRIDYNHYGERTYIKYGNGTETLYDYTPELRRLDNLRVVTSGSEVLLNNSYKYDKIGNILGMVNSADHSPDNFMGGKYTNTYSYDNMNRLVKASGDFEGHPMQYELGNDYNSDYNLAMTYDNTHRIVNKLQTHIKNGQEFLPNTYDNHYQYYENTHRVKQILDPATGYYTDFDYDSNGNIAYRYDNETDIYKHYLWDEADRLRVLYQNYETLHHYIYDASGQRVLKATSHMEALYENGQLVDYGVQMGNYTSYPSSFLVVDPDGIFSKHYYAGSQRIAARIGDKNADELFADKKKSAKLGNTEENTDNTFNPDKLKDLQQKDLQSYLDKAGKIGRLSFKEYRGQQPDEQQQESENNYVAYGVMAEDLIYYYHPDHLGTATYLTDINGKAYEFFLNLPFGETMAEQHSQTGDYVNKWKFTGHELDKETGLYYANARYYDPRTSIWLSVDPLAEKYPAYSPYNYCINNPINVIDLDGRDIIILLDKFGARGAGHQAVLIGDDKNGWTYISKDGAASKSGVSGPAKHIIKKFSSLNDFYNSDHNKSVRDGVYHSDTDGGETSLSESDFVYDEFGYVEVRYKKSFRIETKDYDSDLNSINAAEKEAKSYYKLGSSDCSDVVTEALNVAESKSGNKIYNGNDKNPTNKIPRVKQNNIEKRNQENGNRHLNIESRYDKNKRYDNNAQKIE